MAIKSMDMSLENTGLKAPVSHADGDFVPDEAFVELEAGVHCGGDEVLVMGEGVLAVGR